VAGEVLMSISKDERERAIFRSRRIAQADRESDMATSERIGIKTVAKNLLKRNRPIEEILEDTGLSLAEIEALRNAN
jgi:hypothetical protein